MIKFLPLNHFEPGCSHGWVKKKPFQCLPVVGKKDDHCVCLGIISLDVERHVYI